MTGKEKKGVRLEHISKIYNDPKTGKDRYFTDLTGLKLEVLNADGTSTEPVPAPAEPDAAFDDGALDDMPF